MPEPKSPRCLRVSDLPERTKTLFEISPDADELAMIAQQLDLVDLRKLRFSGHVEADGDRDWRLEADLGATVVQQCVVSLKPVTTRLDEKVIRQFLAHLPEDESDAEEIELPEDESIERLGREIDLDAVMIEALTLALPLYPRAPGAAIETTLITEPGATPLSDEDMRPFAGLKSLRDKLEKDD